MERVNATEKAMDLIRQLKEKHGDLMFYQAGGCCEGTQPQCFKKGEYYLRRFDVCIGEVAGYDFWVDKDLFEYWKHAHFELDVIDAIGAGGFSLEVPLGKTFKVNYKLFTPEELNRLKPVKHNE